MADPSHTATAPAPRRPSRRALTLATAPLVVLVVLGYIGDALAPTLVDTHPAWLIALNARNRNLVLASNYLDAWTFYGIGIVRLLVSDPLFFLLGYWFGDAAVKWMERRTKTWGTMLRQAEGWYAKYAYPIIFVAPNNIVCLFAGAAGMPLRAFFAVNLAGTVFRLWIIRRFGEAFDGPIDSIVGWIGDNRLPLLAVSILAVIVSIALEAKRGESEVQALTHIDTDLPSGDGESGAGAPGDGPGAGGAEAPTLPAEGAAGPDGAAGGTGRGAVGGAGGGAPAGEHGADDGDG